MEAFRRYYLDAIFRHYLDFEGRATRREFWYFVLFNFLVTLALSIVDGALINPLLLHMTPQESWQGGLLQGIYTLAVFLPSLALGVRRLHDIGKSGWWLLVGFIPVVGILVLIFFWVQPSKDGGSLHA